MAASGSFAVRQVATTEPEQLMEDWNKPSPGVRIVETSKVKRNQPIVTFILFTGCKADQSGNCNVTVDFDVSDPAKKIYSQEKASEVWVGYPPPEYRQLQLSASGLGIRFEDKDPLGVYLVEATVTDQVAGITLHTQQQLTVVAEK